MTDDQDKGEGQAGKRAKNPKQDRLKQALRENLKRRKSQARQRSHSSAAAVDEAGISGDDDGAKEPVE
jgi:hypothetical protein